jgi:hypothetical protein
MTDKQLEKLIDELNSNPDSPKFLLTQIAVDIYFGKVWYNLPWENQAEYFGDNYYFINKPDYGFIGSIEASNSEMHVYLKTKFRGKGFMHRSLSETILPHSFWYNKTEKLRITIDQDFHGKRFKKVEKSAMSAGFKEKNTIVENLFEYFAYKNEFSDFKLFKGINNLATEKESRFLYNRINSINAQLQYMKERYEILFGENEEHIIHLKDHVSRFENDYDKKLRSL